MLNRSLPYSVPPLAGGSCSINLQLRNIPHRKSARPTPSLIAIRFGVAIRTGETAKRAVRTSPESAVGQDRAIRYRHRALVTCVHRRGVGQIEQTHLAAFRDSYATDCRVDIDRRRFRCFPHGLESGTHYSPGRPRIRGASHHRSTSR